MLEHPLADSVPARDRVDVFVDAALVQHDDAARRRGREAPRDGGAHRLRALDALPRSGGRAAMVDGRARDVEDEGLGAAEGAHDEVAVAADDDVAQIALEGDAAHKGAAALRRTIQAAVRARDVEEVGVGLVGEPARRGAADAAAHGRARPSRDRWTATPPAAQRDVDASGAVLDDAAPARRPELKEHLERSAVSEIDDVDAIAIGIGGDGQGGRRARLRNVPPLIGTGARAARTVAPSASGVRQHLRGHVGVAPAGGGRLARAATGAHRFGRARRAARADGARKVATVHTA